MATTRKQRFFPYLESQHGNRFQIVYTEKKPGKKKSTMEVMGRLLDSGPVMEGKRVVGVRLKFRPGYFMDPGRSTKTNKPIPVKAQVDWHEETTIEEHDFGPFIEISQQTHTVFEGQRDTDPDTLDPDSVIHDALPDVWLLMGDEKVSPYRELRFTLLA